MGFDVSLHPVDARFLHETVIPYVEGRVEIDDRVDRAVASERVRARAYRWGLALMKWKKIRDLPFDPYLHVWGRPFLIMGKEADTIAWTIDRYLAAGPGEADEIIVEQLQELSPELPGPVEPRPDARPPSDHDLSRKIRWKLDFFRLAYDDLGTDRKVKDPKGNEHDPRELFLNSFPLAAVQFASKFRPGWMSRGEVWPTQLMRDSGLDPDAWFETPRALFAPLEAKIPGFHESLKTTIDEKLTVGGYVVPEKVGPLRDHLKENAEALWGYAEKKGLPREAFLVELRKISEALADAETRRIGLVEASDLYSITKSVIN